MKIDRRTFLGSIAASVFVAYRPAGAQEGPNIIRPLLEGVSNAMSEMAQDGPFLYPSSPTIINASDSRHYLFVPKDIKAFRVVVFSHGALSDPMSYKGLINHWVSHGFLVVAPIHDDAIIESGPTLRRNKAGQVSEWPISALLEDTVAWKTRIDRCVEALDAARDIAVDQGYELILDRVIVAGHGYGAYTAQMLMGATVTSKDGQRISFRDDRFFAGIAMSPQGPGIMGFDDDSWKDIDSPMLFLLAENDDDFTGQPWGVKAEAFNLCKPNYKHMGLVKGANPTVFSQGVDKAASKGVNIFHCVKAMSVCFLKAYGNYEEAAFKNMTNDFFEHNSLGKLVEYRR